MMRELAALLAEAETKFYVAQAALFAVRDGQPIEQALRELTSFLGTQRTLNALAGYSPGILFGTDPGERLDPAGSVHTLLHPRHVLVTHIEAHGHRFTLISQGRLICAEGAHQLAICQYFQPGDLIEVRLKAIENWTADSFLRVLGYSFPV